MMIPLTWSGARMGRWLQRPGFRTGAAVFILFAGLVTFFSPWLMPVSYTHLDVYKRQVLDSTANAVTGRIRISWDPQRAALSQLLQRLSLLGYRPYLAGGEASERARLADRRRCLLYTSRCV